MCSSDLTERIRYRPRRMAVLDWLVAAATLAAPVAVAVCSIAGDGSLTWFATSTLRWPALHVLPALALLPLLVPVLLPRGDVR